MGDIKVRILTEADLKAARSAQESIRNLGEEAGRTEQQLRRTSLTTLDVGAKLEKSLVKGVLAGTLAFKGLHAALQVVGAAFGPVTASFDRFIESLKGLSTRGADFAPIRGLAELFETAASWVDVINSKFDSINTKAKTHADLWRDAAKAADDVARTGEEISDEERFITTQAEQRLKAVALIEKRETARIDAQEKFAKAQAGAEADPLRRAQRQVGVEEQFKRRREEQAEVFRRLRGGVLAGAQEQLLGIRDIAPTVEQFLPALRQFQAADQQSTAARTRLRELEAYVANPPRGVEGLPDRAKILAAQEALPGARQAVSSATASVAAARAGLPVGVTDLPGLQQYVASAEAAQAARTTRRAGLVAGFAERGQEIFYDTAAAQITGPLEARTRAVGARQSILSGAEASAQQNAQLAERAVRAIQDGSTSFGRLTQEIERQFEEMRKRANETTRRLANSQP